MGVMFAQIASRKTTEHASLSKQDLSAIGILGIRGACRIGDVASLLGISQSAATPIVDRLENGGFVERQRGQDDRRVWFVNLTDAGRDVFNAENEFLREVASTMLSPLTTEEQNTLIALLSRMESPEISG